MCQHRNRTKRLVLWLGEIRIVRPCPCTQRFLWYNDRCIDQGESWSARAKLGATEEFVATMEKPLSAVHGKAFLGGLSPVHSGQRLFV